MRINETQPHTGPQSGLQPQLMPMFLRAKDAAAFMGITTATLYRWARTKADFPKPVKLGENASAWRRDELVEWGNMRSDQRRAT